MEPGPSILNMAEAMLENDEYKTSHTSLEELVDDEEDNNDNETKGDQGDENDNQTKPATRKDDKVNRRDNADGGKRSEGRSVVIQEPPKRRKVSPPFTPKEIVDGKFPYR